MEQQKTQALETGAATRSHSPRVAPLRESSQNTFPRTVTRSLKIHETSEGIGSRIRRCIGNRSVRCLPPFVICEQFRMDEKGRPPHPARGAQKITYVLSGKVKVEYSPPNTIELGPGDVTSLMVGKGVIRSVKAVPDPDNPLPGNKKASASGIQIFMDVPESFKRINPSHLNLCHTDIVTCEPSKGCLVSILTGSVFGVKADQMLTATPALMLDCTLSPGASVDIPVKLDWNAFAYVIDGSPHIQGERAQRAQYVEFMRSPCNEGVSTESCSANNDDTGSSGSESSASAGASDSSRSHDNSSNDKQTNGHRGDESGSSGGAYVNISVRDTAKQEARVLFCAAKPLCQPIYRQGPFVDVSMNWIHQAFDDYIERKNGFESGDWNSHRPRSFSTDSEVSTATPSFSSGHGPGPAPSKESAGVGDKDKNNQSADATKGGGCKKDGGNDSPYNPCEDDNSSDGEKQSNKASYPNAFPPGSVNPASHTSAFNGVEAVEEQQEQMVPREPGSPSRKRRRPSVVDERVEAASAVSPPPKKH